MTTSLRKSLPVGYDPNKGIRGLRVRDPLPVSMRSMTNLVFFDRSGADMNTGHVYASRLHLRVWGDGGWWFAGHLDDTSVITGDNYAIGFSFEDGGYGAIKTGELGADATSTPQHVNFAIQGRSEELQRNFFQVLNGGVKFSLHISTDVSQAFSDLGDDLKWLGRQIELFFSYDSSATGTDGVPLNLPPAGGGGGGGGEGDF
ncbi:MAG: hypothetical protein E6P95_01490 [Candidatus Moraniibacteriota bacterium]|nr:MAG: hypothetical protein E6P95_01490 [Candidatus Moranbacteria bacterium]